MKTENEELYEKTAARLSDAIKAMIDPVLKTINDEAEKHVDTDLLDLTAPSPARDMEQLILSLSCSGVCAFVEGFFGKLEKETSTDPQSLLSSIQFTLVWKQRGIETANAFISERKKADGDPRFAIPPPPYEV